MTRNNGIVEYAGELACIDIYKLPMATIRNVKQERYLLGIIDSCTQIAWVELIEDTEALTIMFAALKCFNIFSDYYSIKFREVLSDKSLKLAPRSREVHENPFIRLLKEMDIEHKHAYSSPYIVITSERIKSFWETISADMLDKTTFENKDRLKDKIIEYLYYYNEKRVHQNLGGMTPNEYNQICPRVV